MLHCHLLRTEDRPDAVARVVAAQLHCHGPLENRSDPLAYTSRRLRLHVPDRREDIEHLGARHVGDRPRADPGKGVALQTLPPALRVPAVPPAGTLLFQHAPGGVGKCRHLLRAALFGERVAALAGKLAVGPRLLARLGQRDQRHAAEPQVASAAVDHEPLDPASGAGRLDVEIESLAIAVSSWRGRPNETGT